MNVFIVFCRYSEATKRKCNWAYHMFLDWSFSRNARAVRDPSLRFISGLMEMSNEDLCFALCHLVL